MHVVFYRNRALNGLSDLPTKSVKYGFVKASQKMGNWQSPKTALPAQTATPRAPIG